MEVTTPAGCGPAAFTGITAAIEASDPVRAIAGFEEEMARLIDPWAIHNALFPQAQKILNPPFINPHLPKMHAICRELVPKMAEDDLPALVRLEVSEYARRPKLAQFAVRPAQRGVRFEDVEASLKGRDVEETAALMAALWEEAGPAELSRRLLLLGSAYLDPSLGHSISCTAFILLEAMQRHEHDLQPVFVMLADYFHKGRFTTTPPLDGRPVSADEMNRHLLRAASGGGIVELHDTITIYAIDRVRHLFTEAEYAHLVRSWIEYLKEKDAREVECARSAAAGSFDDFFREFSPLDVERAASAAAALLPTDDGRGRLARYLIRGVCELYDGNYNPHHITGLGSLLWLLDRRPPHAVMVNGVHQYLSYFFGEMTKSAR